MFQRQNYLDSLSWKPVKNVSGEECPPFSIMRIVRFDIEGGFWEIDKPNQDSYIYGIAVNNDAAIPVDGFGSATRDYPCYAATDPDSGSGSGDGGDQQRCGPAAGSWYLDFGQTGFRALSDIDSELDAVNIDLDPFPVTDDSGDPSSGDDCETSQSITFRECDPETQEVTYKTITIVPGGFRTCTSDTPPESGSG